MKEVVLITGSGIIAQHLGKMLESHNFSVRYLSRAKKGVNYSVWNLDNNFIEEGAFKNVQHIIHLAGAGITDKRWTKKRKEEIISSRVDSTKLIYKTLKKGNTKIKTFISASAVGYYGAKTTENIYTEKSLQGDDFLGDVCSQWERTVDSIKTLNKHCRIVKIRIAIVLSKKGGALKKMIQPVKFYLGAPLGSGNQYMPWIHIDDLCDIFIFSIKNNEIIGAYNAVAPEHINNSDLTKVIAQKLKKPLFLPNFPSLFLKLIFGKMSIIFLGGSRVSSDKIMNAGFDFKYKTISDALENLLFVAKK